MFNTKYKKRKITSKKTRKKLDGGGCGCDKALFKGGSFYRVPLNMQNGTHGDPLLGGVNLVSSRLQPQYSITPQLLGGKRKRKNNNRKSKKMKGGNLINSFVDKYLNQTITPNTLNSGLGYTGIPNRPNIT